MGVCCSSWPCISWERFIPIILFLVQREIPNATFDSLYFINNVATLNPNGLPSIVHVLTHQSSWVVWIAGMCEPYCSGPIDQFTLLSFQQNRLQSDLWKICWIILKPPKWPLKGHRIQSCSTGACEGTIFLTLLGFAQRVPTAVISDHCVVLILCGVAWSMSSVLSLRMICRCGLCTLFNENSHSKAFKSALFSCACLTFAACMTYGTGLAK